MENFKTKYHAFAELQKNHYGCVICWKRWAFHFWDWWQSCIKMAKNIVLHARTLHIKKAHHFVHDQIKQGMIILEYVKSKD